MIVSAVRPCRIPLQRDIRFPASVFGPVLLSALLRLASTCLKEVIGNRPPNWVRFVILNVAGYLRRAADASSTTTHERRWSDQYRSSSATRSHRRTDGPHDGVPGKAAQ